MAGDWNRKPCMVQLATGTTAPVNGSYSMNGWLFSYDPNITEYFSGGWGPPPRSSLAIPSLCLINQPRFKGRHKLRSSMMRSFGTNGRSSPISLRLIFPKERLLAYQE